MNNKNLTGSTGAAETQPISLWSKYQERERTGNQYEDLSCGMGTEVHSLWRKLAVVVLNPKLLPPKTKFHT